MLVHLYNPDFGFAMFRPPEQGPLRMSGAPKEFTLIDVCDRFGGSLPVGALRNEMTVTLRDHAGRYVVPDGNKLKLDFFSAMTGKFLLRKVRGSSSDDHIRHGDTVALGAYQVQPARYRWMQLDSHFGLGGITRTYGGATQRPTLFEVNDFSVAAAVDISDLVPQLDDRRRRGKFSLSVTREGLPKASLFDLRVTSVAAQAYAIGNRPLRALPAGGETIEVRVAEGERLRELPIVLDGLTMEDPCSRFVGGDPPLATMSLTYRPLAPWRGPTDAAIRLSRKADFINVFGGGGGILSGADVNGFTQPFTLNAGPFFPFSVTIANGADRLPAGDWQFTLGVEPFPAPGFATTASTPRPTYAPTGGPLTIDANGRFSQNVTFTGMPAPPVNGMHLFCCTATVVRTGPNTPIYQRRFAMRIV